MTERLGFDYYSCMSVPKEISDYMRKIGAQGGKSTSERKAAAARRNGSKRKTKAPRSKPGS